MGAGGKGRVRHSSKTSVSGDHAKREQREVRVSPSTEEKDTANTIRPELVPRACWKVEDICFDFDSAFVRPEAKEAFEEMEVLLKHHPDSKLTLFGHADPVGKDKYNKELSERRAKAVYAVLVRDADIWEELYQKLNQGLRMVQTCLATLGHDPGPIDGQMGSKTRAGIRSFEGEGSAGQNTAGMRKKLFLEYQKWLCPKVSLVKEDNYLAAGECAWQGCGEFNPLRMFSKEQDDHYRQKNLKEERNAENRPNRRVVAFLFGPGTEIAKASWPCTEDAAKCKKRFWSDAEERRKFQGKGREHREDVEDEEDDEESEWSYEVTKDTFACRFYDRIAGDSPCEQPVPPSADPKLKFEVYAYDMPLCEVKAQVRRHTEKPGTTEEEKKHEICNLGAEAAEVVLDFSGSGACKKVSEVSKELLRSYVHGKKFDVETYRKYVMEGARSQPFGKDCQGDAVKYKEGFYSTERGRVIPWIARNEAEMTEAMKTFEEISDQRYDSREMAIQWNAGDRKIEKLVIDGEEFPVDEA